VEKRKRKKRKGKRTGGWGTDRQKKLFTMQKISKTLLPRFCTPYAMKKSWETKENTFGRDRGKKFRMSPGVGD